MNRAQSLHDRGPKQHGNMIVEKKNSVKKQAIILKYKNIVPSFVN